MPDDFSPDEIQLSFSSLKENTPYEFLKKISSNRIKNPNLRSLLVSAHPDDEVMGAGIQISKMGKTEIFILEITDGAPRDMKDARREGFNTWMEYARARKKELRYALERAGIRRPGMIWLNYPDKEACLNLVAITKKIMNCIKELRLDVIFTPPYEGGHPDHDSASFCVHAALKIMPANLKRPYLFEYSSYTMGKNGGIRLDFVPLRDDHTLIIPLGPEETALKKEMVECFKTQINVLKRFPLNVEKLRPAPCYDFSRPPHKGRLYYEDFNWGATGKEWRKLARRALRELGISGKI